MVSAKDILFFGGLKGENSNQNVFVLNLATNVWSNIAVKHSMKEMGRDDHAVADFRDGSFLTFGGYVNGSRVDEIVNFKYEGGSLHCTPVECTGGPCARASMSLGVTHDKKIYMFGGQEDDNRKLCDAWCYDCDANQWTEVPI